MDDFDSIDYRDPSFDEFISYNVPVPDNVAYPALATIEKENKERNERSKLESVLSASREAFQNKIPDVSERTMLYFVIFFLIIVIAFIQANASYKIYKLARHLAKQNL